MSHPVALHFYYLPTERIQPRRSGLLPFPELISVTEPKHTALCSVNVLQNKCITVNYFSPAACGGT